MSLRYNFFLFLTRKGAIEAALSTLKGTVETVIRRPVKSTPEARHEFGTRVGEGSGRGRPDAILPTAHRTVAQARGPALPQALCAAGGAPSRNFVWSKGSCTGKNVTSRALSGPIHVKPWGTPGGITSVWSAPTCWT